MGRKGVSIRKPRKSKSSANKAGGYSNTRTGDGSPVHSLVKDTSAPDNRSGANPSAGPGMKHKKGN